MARKLTVALALALIGALVMASSALALTRRHDVSGDDMHEFGVSFRSVGWIEARTDDGQFVRYCSAVLVTPDTAVTAGHCVTGSDHVLDIDISQTWFYLGNFRISPQAQAPVSSVEISAGWACEACEDNGLYRAGWDVAVLHFGTVLHEPVTSRIYVGDMIGREVAVVGYGKLSTGLESFEDFGASAQDGRKMAGTNVVDAMDNFGPVEQQSGAWLFDFDSPACDKPWVATVFGPSASNICPTDMEASYGAGDSGGPMFVLIDGEWMLAGVASSILALDGNFGTYGQMAFVTNLTLEENRVLLESAGLLENALVATPTPTPTPTPSPSPSPTPTMSPTPTVTPTPTPTPSPTPSPTIEPTPTPTAPPSPTPTASEPPTPTATSVPPSPTSTPAPTPTVGGNCNGGGAADAALLLLPAGVALVWHRRRSGSGRTTIANSHGEE